MDVKTSGGSTRQMEASHDEVVVEREGGPDLLASHQDEARGIHRRQLVEIPALEVRPGLLQVSRRHGEEVQIWQLIQGLLPGEGHVSGRIAIQEREGLENDRHRRVQSCSQGLKVPPEIPCSWVERVTSEGEGDPGPRVDEDPFAFAHQGSS